MTGRNPDGIEDFPSPDCPDVAYGPPRLNAIIGAYGAFLDRSAARRPQLPPRARTARRRNPASAQTFTRAELDDLNHG
jgi:hypothetical protein